MGVFACCGASLRSRCSERVRCQGRLPARTSRSQNQPSFCLLTLRRSRTETARGRGCLASEFVCQAVSPRGRTDACLQPRSLQMWERPGNVIVVPKPRSARSRAAPRFAPGAASRPRSRLTVSHAGSRGRCLYLFISLTECPQFHQVFGLLW